MFPIFSESMSFSTSEDTIRYTEYCTAVYSYKNISEKMEYRSFMLDTFSNLIFLEENLFSYTLFYLFFFFLFTYLHLCAEHSKNGETRYITRISILR